jgi:hypothetical protein
MTGVRAATRYCAIRGGSYDQFLLYCTFLLSLIRYLICPKYRTYYSTALGIDSYYMCMYRPARKIVNSFQERNARPREPERTKVEALYYFIRFYTGRDTA